MVYRVVGHQQGFQEQNMLPELSKKEINNKIIVYFVNIDLNKLTCVSFDIFNCSRSLSAICQTNVLLVCVIEN
jgi:hypothetical protein